MTDGAAREVAWKPSHRPREVAKAKNTILFNIQVWVVLDVSLTLPMSFVLSTNCTCYPSTSIQYKFQYSILHICIRTHNAQCYVLAFQHVLLTPLCHSNKGDLNNYTPFIRLSLRTKKYKIMFFSTWHFF